MKPVKVLKHTKPLFLDHNGDLIIAKRHKIFAYSKNGSEKFLFKFKEK